MKPAAFKRLEDRIRVTKGLYLVEDLEGSAVGGGSGMYS